jgi:carboxylesterase type B
MTLWGQSAGAASVDYYSYAYPSQPLVQGLIMDSGFVSPQNSPPESSNFTFIASQVGCGNKTASTELDCMRNVTADSILTAFTASLASGVNFGPVLDERIIFSNYTGRALKGKIANIVCLDHLLL